MKSLYSKVQWKDGEEKCHSLPLLCSKHRATVIVHCFKLERMQGQIYVMWDSSTLYSTLCCAHWLWELHKAQCCSQLSIANIPPTILRYSVERRITLLFLFNAITTWPCYRNVTFILEMNRDDLSSLEVQDCRSKFECKFCRWSSSWPEEGRGSKVLHATLDGN